jgi:hypothetical protein
MLIIVLDMMHRRCLRQSAVSLAVNAKETITMQHSLPHSLPPFRCAELCFRHRYHLQSKTMSTMHSQALKVTE